MTEQKKEHELGVGIDFDHTLLTVHTGGRILRSELALFQAAVNPEALSFLAWCHVNGIRVGIVTFSDDRVEMMPWKQDPRVMIRDNRYLSGSEMITSILLPHVEKYRIPLPMIVTGMIGLTDKNSHLAYLASMWKLAKKCMLLIDDDVNNVQQAKKHGYMAISVPPGKLTVSHIAHNWPVASSTNK